MYVYGFRDINEKTMYFCFNEMTELTELLETNDIDKLKYELVPLVQTKDYKTINALLRRHPNTCMYNTREINEEILCDYRHCTKQKDALKFDSKPRARV